MHIRVDDHEDIGADDVCLVEEGRAWAERDALEGRCRLPLSDEPFLKHFMPAVNVEVPREVLEAERQVLHRYACMLFGYTERMRHCRPDLLQHAENAEKSRASLIRYGEVISLLQAGEGILSPEECICPVQGSVSVSVRGELFALIQQGYEQAVCS